MPTKNDNKESAKMAKNAAETTETAETSTESTAVAVIEPKPEKHPLQKALKNAKGQPIAVESVADDYMFLSVSLEEIAETLRANTGKDDANFGKFEYIKLPAPGDNWVVKNVLGVPEDTESPIITGIILGATPRRSLWESAYGTGGSAKPVCQSFDMVHGVGKYGIEALRDDSPEGREIKRLNPTGFCKGCHWDEFKTAQQGGGKACREQLNVLFVPTGCLKPVVLSISVGGMDVYNTFATALSQFLTRVQDVEVAIKTVRLESKQSKIKFNGPQISITRILPAAERAAAREFATLFDAYLHPETRAADSTVKAIAAAADDDEAPLNAEIVDSEDAPATAASPFN